jgi:hypothetical protein
MSQSTMPKRYSIVQVQLMMSELSAWIDQTEETLGNEEGKEYPSEDRLDRLQTRLDALQTAYDALSELD